jgi:branched-chain amino acid transport system ATP-binding protein
MNKSTRILLDEHRAISAVLHALQHLARAAQDPAIKPDFEVFRAMIYYIDEFPERLHHPKEDSQLFACLEKRSSEARALIDELRAEHVKGAGLIRDVERALVAFRESWPRGAEAFIGAVNAYAHFHWQHMRKEEERLLPLAERHLLAEDWRAIEEAFSLNRDPIADLREQDFQGLFSRIVNIAPAPVGLGESWKRVSA